MGRPKGSRNKPKQQQPADTPATNDNELKVSSVVFTNYLETTNWVDTSGTISPELEAAIIKAQDESLPSQEAIKPLCDLLIEHLESVIGEGKVKEAYFIRHLQDVELDSEGDAIAQRTKLPHLHMVISLGTSKGTRYPISKWAEGLYCRQHMVNKMGKGRWAKDNALSYLIHIKDEDKMQYEPQDVYTARGTNYLEIWYESKERWLKGRATKKKNMVVSQEAIDDLVQKIMYEGLSRRELALNDEYRLIKVYSKGIIDNALKVAAESNSAASYAALEKGEFRTSVFFIAGHLGSCKTHYAKMLIKKICAWAHREFGQHWNCATLADRNPLDDYNGEEIILMDDTKVDALTLGGWLQLLDPNNSSTASARYANKPDVAPRVIIITSTQDPMRYFFFLKNRSNENLGQLYRRITKVVDLTNTNPMYDLDTLPDDADIVCNLYSSIRYSDMRTIPIETMEEYGIRLRRMEPDTNPFAPAEHQLRSVKTDVGFERDERYPNTLHPTAVCDLLVEVVAHRHHRDYVHSQDTIRAIKQSICEYTINLSEDLRQQFRPLNANPFLEPAPSN